MEEAGQSTIVVALDLQNDIVHPEGKVGRHGPARMAEERGLLAKARGVMDAARARGIGVVHVRVGYRADFSDALSVSPRVARLKEAGALVLGTWGTEFVDDAAPRGDELVFTKQSVDPFVSTNLANWLLRRGARELVIFGVATNLVVESTARHGDDLGFAVTVLEDCCASLNAELHAFSAERVLPMFGRVTSSDALLEEWGGQR